MFEVGGYAEGYCVARSCRAKRTFEVEEVGTAKNGCPTAKGKCPECGRTLLAIGKKVAS